MYKHIDPFEEKLIEIKREWISDSFYKIFILIFGNKLGTIQPFRWILHKKIKKEKI